MFAEDGVEVEGMSARPAPIIMPGALVFRDGSRELEATKEGRAGRGCEILSLVVLRSSMLVDGTSARDGVEGALDGATRRAAGADDEAVVLW